MYRNLTGDTSDPFPYFAGLLAAAYPPDQVASIPGPNPDDPWPLGSLSFVGATNTWGQDEFVENSSGVGAFDFQSAYTYIQKLLHRAGRVPVELFRLLPEREQHRRAGK